MAIGLEVYKRKSRLSIWVPKIVSQCRLERDIILHRKPITKEDKETLDIYVKDFVSAKSRVKRFAGVDQTAKISIRFADITDMVQRSWDSYETQKRKLQRELTRKPDYEKQEYFSPPLAASNPAK
jgi:hypothetical protein